MIFSEKYAIIKPLGNQKNRRFSHVFLIEETSSKTQFVLKYIQKNTATEFEFNQLKQEARCNFVNEGLPKVIETYENENEFFLVLKYKEGLELGEYFKTLKSFQKIKQLILISKLLIPIFSELNSKHIVHCDLKPSNFLFNPQTNSIHLLDFGLSLDSTENNSRKRIFQLGFAAPELILKQHHLISPKTDAFSLAVMFWTLIESKLPFQENNPTIYTNLQLSHPLPSLTKRLKKIDLIIQQATIKPIFKKSLYKINEEEIQLEIKKSIHNRMDLMDFLKSIANLKLEKNKLIPNIFSVTNH